MAATAPSTAPAVSRAVRRRVEPGSRVRCAACDGEVRFVARDPRIQVIANVYVDGRWDRVEHYHADCYEEAGEPHGSPNSDQGRADHR